MDTNQNQETLPGGSEKLVRALGMREGITMTAGIVVGVGLFTVGANGVGMLGGMIILSSFIAFIISLWPALLYAEMGTMFPLAGGTYNYAQKGITRLVANMAGWNYVVAVIASTGGESLAFANYFGYLMKAFGIDLNWDPRILAAAISVLFIVVNFRGIKVAARWQNAFIFFFWACALVWFVYMASHVNLAYYFPDAAAGIPNFGEFVQITGLVWWCFAGFELVATIGGEIKYPQINIPRVLIISPFIIFAITAMFQWFLVGLVTPTVKNYQMLQVSSAPYAEGLMAAGFVGIPIIILCIGIVGGTFGTINPGVGGPARYVFRMAEEGVLPRLMGNIHPKFKTPHISVVIIGIIILALVSTNSIIFVASLSLFSILCCYIIAFIAYIGLKIRYRDMKRPFKAPGGVVGAVVSIVIYAVLISQIGTDALITGIIYTAAVTVFYLVKTRVFKGSVTEVNIDELLLEEMPDPPPDEKKKMDRSFRLWLTIAVAAAAFVIIMYVVAFLHRG
ncbi:MAG: amino acid permease [Clostridiales bacterium]|nr:amino acid permease [Clostridiales bacterium]